MAKLQPVLLSGGSGTRLWPLSREAYPKQFLPLAGDDTMVQATWRRVEAIAECAFAAIGAVDDYALHEGQRAVVEDVAARCREALAEHDMLLLAEQLRVAALNLGRLLGVDATEAMLNMLFQRFCVGK